MLADNVYGPKLELYMFLIIIYPHLLFPLNCCGWINPGAPFWRFLWFWRCLQISRLTYLLTYLSWSTAYLYVGDVSAQGSSRRHGRRMLVQSCSSDQPSAL